jgi:5-methylcytosine-specific restriction endonuclease McrA
MLHFTCKHCSKSFSHRKGGENKGQFCSVSCQAKFHWERDGDKRKAEWPRGEESPAWRGGRKDRPSSEHTIRRRAVRAKEVCDKCGEKDGLQAHHVKSYREYPELREDLNNIQVLCEDCHAREHPKYANLLLWRRNRGRQKALDGSSVQALN